MNSVIAEIGISLLNAVPAIIAWTAGIVMAVMMVRRGGSKAEKLLLIGCCLMLVESILSPVVRELVMNWVRGEDTSAMAIGRTVTYTQIPLIIISLVGIVCLIWAFWIKFRVKRQGMA